MCMPKKIGVLLAGILLSVLVLACGENAAKPSEVQKEYVTDTLYVDVIDTVVSVSVDTVVENHYRDVISHDTISRDSDCVMKDSNGVIMVSCGEKKVSVFKDLCDSISFNPTEHFCYEGKILDFCEGYAYNPNKFFCQEDSLYVLCQEKEYDATKYTCYKDSLVGLCDEGVFDLSKQFCKDGKVYDLCKESLYNPEIEFCQDDQVFLKCNGQSYDVSQWFCHEDVVYGFCDGEKYDPLESECYNEKIYNTFIDERDGQSYRYVTIGTQTWMAENLNYADSVNTLSLKGKSWCYEDAVYSCDKRGRQYTWAAAIDSVALANDEDEPLTCGCGKVCNLPKIVRGICPEGWHLPNEDEWRLLVSATGGRTAGEKLKSVSGWNENGNGSDDYGFSALPVGNYDGKGGFVNVGKFANFWSTKGSVSKDQAYAMTLFSGDELALLESSNKFRGLSIRCIQNSN